MRRRLSTVVRLLAVAAGVLLLCYAAARLVLTYQIHRASEMLAKLEGVKVGDSEDSIRLVLKRFGGYRWDVQLGALEDFNYVLEINPWHFPTLPNYKSGEREHPIGLGMNARLRRALGFRQWLVTSELAVKKQQVVAVQADLLVEGKNMWLGTSWRLSEKLREFGLQGPLQVLDTRASFDLDFVSPAILEMGTGAGTSWGFSIKPSSPNVQRQVAKQWNYGCLDSFRGCDNLCDLLPGAARFFNEHSELAPRGGGWDENSRSCKHHPNEGRY